MSNTKQRLQDIETNLRALFFNGSSRDKDALTESEFDALMRMHRRLSMQVYRENDYDTPSKPCTDELQNCMVALDLLSSVTAAIAGALPDLFEHYPLAAAKVMEFQKHVATVSSNIGYQVNRLMDEEAQVIRESEAEVRKTVEYPADFNN
jgi:hypothetical protein